MSDSGEAASGHPVPGEVQTAAFSAALIAIGPLALFIYTPALPMLEASFGALQTEVQFTVIVYFLGFALAQLLYGPLSDAFGRRPVCLSAVGVFIAGSLLALLAADIGSLTVARLIQGIGAAAGSVIARAVVRDAYTGAATDRILNLMALILGIGPAFAPFIGGLVVDTVGWRHVFSCLLIYGIVLFAALAWFMPETNHDRKIERARPLGALRLYAGMVRDSRFLVPTLIGSLVLASFYAASTVMPYVLIEQVGLSPSAYGTWLLLQPSGFVLGTLAGRVLMRRVRLSSLVPVSMGMLGLAAIAVPTALLSVGPGPAQILIPFCAIGFATALIMPVLWSVPLIPFGYAAGAAASMFGFFQYGTGLIGSAVAAAIGHPLAALAAVASVMVLSAIVFWALFWKRAVGPNGTPEE